MALAFLVRLIEGRSLSPPFPVCFRSRKEFGVVGAHNAPEAGASKKRRQPPSSQTPELEARPPAAQVTGLLLWGAFPLLLGGGADACDWPGSEREQPLHCVRPSSWRAGRFPFRVPGSGLSRLGVQSPCSCVGIGICYATGEGKRGSGAIWEEGSKDPSEVRFFEAQGLPSSTWSSYLLPPKSLNNFIHSFKYSRGNGLKA